MARLSKTDTDRFRYGPKILPREFRQLHCNMSWVASSAALSASPQTIVFLSLKNVKHKTAQRGATRPIKNVVSL